MENLLLFAGTTEGRELAQFLERQGVSCHVCVATEYGEQLLDEKTLGHQIHRGRLDQEEMEALMERENIRITVDATHPYAAAVSSNIRAACEKAGSRYLRLLREEAEADEHCVFVDSVEAAVEYLKGTSGHILAATGSKELARYTALPGYRERVTARVLSTPESVAECARLGFQGKNLICMQGPFDEELNYAMLKQTGAAFLVTKESGKTGGFPQKLRAARRAGARLVVVGRPSREEGYSGSQVRGILCRELGISCKRQISLVGIGMGNPDNMTLEARAACRQADVLIGAERMLKTLEELDKPCHQAYLADDIVQFLEEHPEYERAAILLSGDAGFYSGAKKLLERFSEDQVKIYCGISSVVYLCGMLRTSWDDAALVSIHGRNQNLIDAVRSHRKVFSLVGKAESFRQMCRDLVEYGFGDVRVDVGCELSYPGERILTGTAESLLDAEPGDLSAVLIRREGDLPVVTHGMEDERFERDRVPMTKSEVRSISLSKLELCRDSVIYDVGAGTGSVSVEAALQAPEGMVYAVEKKPEAAGLIRRNQKKFGAPNLQVVEGLAPEALEELPVPTHAFIGGSSGNLKEILELLLRKNPRVRIVINAIALETVSEAMACIRQLPLDRVDIAAVSVAKAKSVGNYHMMMGQNPVYVISCGGAGAGASVRSKIAGNEAGTLPGSVKSAGDEASGNVRPE